MWKAFGVPECVDGRRFRPANRSLWLRLSTRCRRKPSEWSARELDVLARVLTKIVACASWARAVDATIPVPQRLGLLFGVVRAARSSRFIRGQRRVFQYGSRVKMNVVPVTIGALAPTNDTLTSLT
jgi:hypothetical protein